MSRSDRFETSTKKIEEVEDANDVPGGKGDAKRCGNVVVEGSRGSSHSRALDPEGPGSTPLRSHSKPVQSPGLAVLRSWGH